MGITDFSNILAGLAGITSDANSLVNFARNSAQKHLYSYDEDIPVEMLVQRLCDMKQGYTQYGGLRPFGVSLLYVGWDPLYGFQLYQSDPSGNYSGWKATCIGANHSSAASLLKQDYKDDLTLEDAKSLCLKVMSKTMDSTKLGSEKGASLYNYSLMTTTDLSRIRNNDIALGDKATTCQDLPTIRTRRAPAQA